MRTLVVIYILLLNLSAQDIILPIEEKITINFKKALLGKKLFFEKKLSRDNTVSCASCHIINEGGDDNARVSTGINGKKGFLNAPTILNVKYNFVQFWDGRAKNLEEQVLGPIHNPVEMGSSIDEVVNKLRKNTSYVARFKEVYKDSIEPQYVVDAIVEFEKALITPNSKFDKYLRGNKEVLNDAEKEGYKLFKTYGCISCHNGINIGGNLFQKMGILKEPEFDSDKYLGRYNVTKDEEDKYFFKVPTLRNISETAPYFHNGEAKTLEYAIEEMLEYQIGVTATKEEIEKLVAFLKTLSGERPKIMDFDE